MMKSGDCFFLAVILVCLYSAGCATVYGRQNDLHAVHFDSNLAGAKVECGWRMTDMPGSLVFKQSKSHKCAVTHEGKTLHKFKIKAAQSREGFRYSTEINKSKWGLWTLGLGIPIGWTVDYLSGAMKSLEDDKYFFTVQAGDEAHVEGKGFVGKTVSIAGSLVKLPHKVTDVTTDKVLDTTVRSGTQNMGVASEEGRTAVDQKVEGTKIAERLQATSTKD